MYPLITQITEIFFAKNLPDSSQVNLRNRRNLRIHPGAGGDDNKSMNAYLVVTTLQN
jgi:hypothetical protein